YIAPPPVALTVLGGNLSISPGTLYVGKDLESQLGIYGDNFQTPVKLTVRSSDPSRVLVSASPSAIGQSSVDLVNQAGQQALVYVQVLSDSGSATVVVSAPGYQDATSTIQLSPAAVELSGQPSGTLTTVSGPVSFQARLIAFTPQSYSFTVESLRPGA